MNRIEWDDRYALGITLLDEQHKGWIDKLNELSAAIESNQEAAHILDTLNFIVRYSESHFTAEERLMEAHNYPLLDQHRMEHKKFRATLKAFLPPQTGETDQVRKVSSAVNDFQVSWLVSHIQTLDRAFADFLNENVADGVPESL